MAVEKAAPIPDVCATAAACRRALEATVEEFTETFASVPMTTIKRRLKGATIVMPNGFDHVEVECKGENKPCDAVVVVKKA